MTLEKQELDRIEAAKTAIGTVIAGKGVAVPSGTKLDGMAALIDGIEAGGEDVSAETAEYTELLTDLETAIDALPDAGSGGGGTVLETCTVTLANHAKQAFATGVVDGVMSFAHATNSGSSFAVVKNTTVIVIADNPRYTNTQITGDATLKTFISTTYAFFVSGDCTISITS